MDILITDSTPSSQIVVAPSVTLSLPGPSRAFYRHGWQSWSLAAWTDPARELPVMKPEIFHSRQSDPVYAKHPHPNGSWLGAVEMQDGQIILLGALGLEAHVSLCGNQLQGWYESGEGEWVIARGNELEIFEQYANLLGERFGKATTKSAPRVWCSWYSFYKEISEKKIAGVLKNLGDLPFDVIQIDDGWQVAPGDWIPNEKFPSGMDSLAASIRSTGRKAGLWLAPLIIGEKSSIYRDHPDWLIKNFDGKPVHAGFEWGGNTYALDATHPEAAKWLENTIRSVVNWGYEYLKLDFLFASGLPGKRHADMPREASYRRTLEIMRRAAGDAYLLVCGSPIIPSLGLCDAIRVGPDVANAWDSRMYSYLLYNLTTPGVKNAIRTTLNRLWLKPLVRVDPDVAYFHASKLLTAEQRQLFQDLTEICGFKATSDLPASWTEPEREQVRAWLTTPQESAREERTAFTVGGRSVDFRSAMDLPARPHGFALIERAVLSWLGEQLWALKLWDWILRAKPMDEA